MTLMGICRECVEENRPGRPPQRQYLKRGPDGRKLCSSHAKEAWNDCTVSPAIDHDDTSIGEDSNDD